MTQKSFFILSVLVFAAILLAPGLPLVSHHSAAQAQTPEVVATNLEVPWALAFAPDGRIFLTERRGRVRVIDPKLGLLPDPVIDLSPIVFVSGGGESGMLGIAVDPNFADNHYLYVYYTSIESRFRNVVERLIEQDNQATRDQIIVDNIPAATIHDGGRVKFGPDGKLYIGTGDATCMASQNIGSLGGKILRVNPDGSPPDDNPFIDDPRFEAQLVYSYGHRNVQGLAFDANGQLYNTEHGPTGDCGYPGSSYDEVNIIHAGGNYGWPLCRGRCGDPRWIDPIWLVLPPDTAAPSGATFYTADQIPQWTGHYFFATMGFPGNQYARHIHRIEFDPDDGVTILDEEILYRPPTEPWFGRIRDVVQGPDGFIYFTTTNRDGRGGDVLRPDDDKVVRIVP